MSSASVSVTVRPDRRIGAVVGRYLYGIAVRIHLEVARADELELIAADDREQRLIGAAGDGEGWRIVPTVSASVVVRVTTGVVFSATFGAAVEVNTGALSFTSPTLMVNSRSALSAPTVARAVRL